MRSLDAIHLATATVLGPDLTGLATYDDRLADAGNDAGFEIVSPRGQPAHPDMLAVRAVAGPTLVADEHLSL
ncbi:hypothetical protein [Streptomyces sp. NBC_01716]|uniref:hypothetical protein n=1 Tax=Streptomyces sp. NBC_01716 TaxID=2975917 RepID=UPI002E355F32|nr:hypothetical protein [Streptomyces sp. NBC_01716]